MYALALSLLIEEGVVFAGVYDEGNGSVFGRSFRKISTQLLRSEFRMELNIHVDLLELYIINFVTFPIAFF